MATIQRNRPGSMSARRRKIEAITLGDRLVCLCFGAGAGLLFWAITYSVLFGAALMVQSKPKVAERIAAGLAPATPGEIIPEFWYWGAVCAAVLSLFGTLAGPARMMDGLERLFVRQSDFHDDFLSDVASSNDE